MQSLTVENKRIKQEQASKQVIWKEPTNTNAWHAFWRLNLN